MPLSSPSQSRPPVDWLFPAPRDRSASDVRGAQDTRNQIWRLGGRTRGNCPARRGDPATLGSISWCLLDACGSARRSPSGSAMLWMVRLSDPRPALLPRVVTCVCLPPRSRGCRAFNLCDVDVQGKNIRGLLPSPLPSRFLISISSSSNRSRPPRFTPPYNSLPTPTLLLQHEQVLHHESATAILLYALLGLHPVAGSQPRPRPRR